MLPTKYRLAVKDMQANNFPQNLHITITGDQSDQTRQTLHDLINTIIIGFLLVTIILMFFMGATNALFVGLSVPLSMCLAFLILPGIGYSMNMIVLFAFLLGLGIVVDDAIVVIENTHRIFNHGKVNIVTAAKGAAGEVFLPVLAGTATTLSPFIPLAFWPGIIGKFMHFMPVTLIITLTASLFVAYILNPVFAVSFMKAGDDERGSTKNKWTRGTSIVTVIFFALAMIFFAAGVVGMANFTLTVLVIYLLYRFVIIQWVYKFQHKAWPAFQQRYTLLLKRALRHPTFVLLSTILLFIFSIVLFSQRTPNVVFFPRAIRI